MSNHDGHQLKYAMFGVDIQQDAIINEDGDIEVVGDVAILKFSGETSIYCDTCQKTVRAGEDGLSEDWQVM